MVESVHWKSLGCMTQEIKGKIGLYFGTFNPPGHLVIANHMAHYTDLDEVGVVTPQNPHKSRVNSWARRTDCRWFTSPFRRTRS